MNHLKMRTKEWILLMILAMLWGSAFFFNEIALRALPPLTVVCCRVILASLTLHTILWFSGTRISFSWLLWGKFFLLGAISNLIPFTLVIWGQQYIDSSLAAILNATVPFFTVLFAHFLTRDELLSFNRIAGVLLGILGVVLLMGPDVLKGLGLKVWGQIAVLAACCCYSFAAIYGRYFKAFPRIVTTAGMLTGTTVMILPMAVIIDRPWNLNFTVSALGAIGGLAFFCTILAYLIWFHLLAEAGATNSTLVTFLIPVVSLLLGTLLLGEQLEWSVWLGMGLIFIALTVVDGRFWRKKTAVEP